MYRSDYSITMCYKSLPLQLLFFLTLIINGQIKYEREFHIKENDFPKKAIDYISASNFDTNKIKYYVEVDSTKKSFEAKFKHRGRRYSLEFDTKGNLEDIEVAVGNEKLGKATKKRIAQYLNSIYKRHRVLKIQLQYTSKSVTDVLQLSALAKKTDTLVTHNYELLVAARKKGEGFSDYELLFDQYGYLLSFRKSVPPAYGYILY